MLGKLILFISLICSVLLYLMAPACPNRAFLGVCVVIATILLFIHIKGIYVEEELKNVYLRHSVIFLIAFFVVFFQKDLDYSLGILNKNSTSIGLFFAKSPQVVSKACALSLLALSSFMLGYYTYINRCRDCLASKYVFRYTKEILIGGYFLLFLYIFQHGIGDFAKGKDEDTTILIILQSVLLVLTVIYAYDIRYNSFDLKVKSRKFIVPLILILLYVFVYFASGNRGGAIKVCLMLVVAYVFVSGNQVNNKRIATIAIAGAFAVSLLGIIRTMGDKKDVNAATELIAQKETISPLTVELAGSVNTVHIAMGNVPSKQDYNYGSSFFPRFNVLVPGLNRILAGTYETSEDIITLMYFGGYMPSWGWGFASSAIADVYISFGMLGVLIVFFIFGRFIHYLEYGTFCVRKSPLFLVLSFCVYSQLISLCRGPFAILFLSWDYAAIMVFICMMSIYDESY